MSLLPVDTMKQHELIMLDELKGNKVNIGQISLFKKINDQIDSFYSELDGIQTSFLTTYFGDLLIKVEAH